MLHRPGFASSSLSSSSFSFGISTKMRKQYALQIDFICKNSTNKKLSRPYRRCSSLDLKDQKDTSTFRTHPVFLKSSVARRKENLLTWRKIHFENITQANEFIFSTYSCWSKLVIVCPNISEVNMKSKLECNLFYRCQLIPILRIQWYMKNTLIILTDDFLNFP